MRVYTKGGDKGDTDLIGSSRVGKDHLKVKAYGSSDELSASLGLVRAALENPSDAEMLLWIQKKIILLNTELASTEEVQTVLENKISQSDVNQLEVWIDSLSNQIPEFKDWIIAGEDPVSSLIHFARTVARRAEREIVALHHAEKISLHILEFVNRLSDFLFQFARKIQMDMQVKKIKSSVEHILKSQTNTANFETVGRLARAEEIVKAAKDKAYEIGIPVTVAVVDASGHLLTLSRMDRCLLGSLDIAQSKAKTSVFLEMTTEMVGKLSQPGEVLFGIENSNGGLTPFGGGIPIHLKSRENGVWGAIGVSGGSVEEDIIIATAGLKVFREADE